MKRNILIVVLSILCSALIFETGYLMGLNRKIKIRRACYNQHRPVASMRDYPVLDWEDSRDIALMQRRVEYGESLRPPIKKRGYFFVTAMTSKDLDQVRIISINLPGLNKDVIKIEVKGGELMIKALQKQEKRVDKKGFHEESMSATNFMQTLTLPRNAIAQDISAEYKDEVLTIVIPKAKEARKPVATIIKIPVK